jgi:hypothetical protein
MIESPRARATTCSPSGRDTLLGVAESLRARELPKLVVVSGSCLPIGSNGVPGLVEALGSVTVMRSSRRSEFTCSVGIANRCWVKTKRSSVKRYPSHTRAKTRRTGTRICASTSGFYFEDFDSAILPVAYFRLDAVRVRSYLDQATLDVLCSGQREHRV